MATIKSYTDLEQSKKLAEILLIESADMVLWGKDFKSVCADIHAQEFMTGLECKKMNYVPCWSLASLLGVLPNNEHITTTLSRGGWKIEPPEYIDKWWCEYEDADNTRDFSVSADSPVDACVEMIELLKERDLL